jgi:hypothetical protein
MLVGEHALEQHRMAPGRVRSRPAPTGRPRRDPHSNPATYRRNARRWPATEEDMHSRDW